MRPTTVGSLQPASGALRKQRKCRGEACRARPVETGGGGIAAVAHETGRDQEGDGGGARHRQEDGRPAKGVDHQARRDRAEGQSDAEGGAEQGKSAHAGTIVELLRKCRRTAGEGKGGGNALRGAGKVEPEDRGRHGGSQRKQAEGRGTDQEDAFAAIGISQRARRHQRGAEGQHEGVGHPVERDRAAAERPADGGQRHGRACEGERHGESGQTHRDENERFFGRARSLFRLNHDIRGVFSPTMSAFRETRRRAC